jgi:hypothetical protein
VTTEAGLSGEDGREIECPGAQIQVPAVGPLLPADTADGVAPPALVEPQADDPVQAIVGGRDGGEHGPHVGALCRTAMNG